VDIGTLTGRIDIEDNLTGKVTSLTATIWKFAEDAEGAFGAAAVAAGALTTAVVGVGASILALGSKGSVLIGVESAFDHLAESAGTTGEALRSGLSEGVRDTVSQMTLMESTSRLLSSGMKLTQADTVLMGEAARAMGKATGTDAAGGLQTLSNALLTGKTRSLAMAGIIVDLKTAEDAYGASLGLTASQLDHEQKLHADRIAILSATQTYVNRLGTSQLDLKERIQQAGVAIEEWFAKLEKAIATSPAISAALDNLQMAWKEAFGGDSQSMLDTLVGWINKFANAVGTYGPVAIRWMGDIKRGIVEIYQEVQHAWSLVPDWFKNIAFDAGIAAVAVGATGYAFKTASSGWQDSISIGANLAQMMGTSLPNAIRSTYTILTSLPKGFAAARAAIEAFTERTVLARLATAALSTQLGVGLVTMGSAAAVVTVAYQAYKLWQESSERAAAAHRQAAVDASNLAILNAKLGTSYTDIDKATEAWFAHMKAHPVLPPELPAELTAAEKALKALTDQLTTASSKIDATNAAFAKLTETQKANREVQAVMIPLLDAHVAKSIQLTAAEKRFYDQVTLSRVNQMAYDDEVLKANGLTLARIDALKAQGLSEAEIAAKLGVTADAYKRYGAELEQLKKLTDELVSDQIKMSGTSTDAAIAQHQREYQDAVRNLDKTSAYYAETMSKLAALRDQKDADEDSSWSSLATKSRHALQQVADGAARDYERMIESGDFFQQDLEAQRQKVFDLQQAAHGMGDAFVDASKRAADALAKQKAAADEAWEAAKKLRDLGGSFDVTAANFAQAIHDTPLANGGTLAGGEDLAKKGYSFAEIVQYLEGGKLSPTPIGPRIPGFRAGGVVRVGEGGDELVQLPVGSQVYPHGEEPGGGGMHNTFYVNGTAEESARKIADILMQQSKNRRQYGSVG
jgi:hypothetical protein